MKHILAVKNWGTVLFGLLILSGCDSNGNKEADLDHDGVVDSIDCAPENSTQWILAAYQSEDNDLDGRFVESYGEVCFGEQLPANLSLDSVGEEGVDCDDTNNQIWQLADFQSEDKDLDGKFVPALSQSCIGELIPVNRLVAKVSIETADCNDNDINAWALLPYAAIDVDTDGKLVNFDGLYCGGDTLPPKYSTEQVDLELIDCNDSDAQTWGLVGYSSLDLDFDGRSITASGQLCIGESFPAGYYSKPVENEMIDCDDNNELAWQVAPGFTDKDGDGIGSGTEQLYCVGQALPAQVAAIGGDCDDTNAKVWLTHHYQSIDKDLDGIFIPVTGQLCTGGDILPNGFSANLPGITVDCDDSSNLKWQTVNAFVDLDGDGFGVGRDQSYCIGLKLPEKLSLNSGDCDDTNGDIFTSLPFGAIDIDLDGYQVHSTGSLCTGGSLTQTHHLNFDESKLPDCDDDDINAWRLESAFIDQDGDGFGVGSDQSYCIGSELPENLSLNSNDCDDTNGDIFTPLPFAAIDIDLDGYQVHSTGSLCTDGSLKQTHHLNFDASKLVDCDDDDINTWRLESAFVDLDGDGFGVGSDMNYCIGSELPENLSLNANDCDDTNGDIFTSLPYGAIDIDLDGYQVHSTGSLCTNGSLIQTHHLKFDESKLPDCDDNEINTWRLESAFVDLDGDGFGIGNDKNYCIGSELPENLSLNANDCDDTNGDIFTSLPFGAIDIDLDGYQTHSTGSLCTDGALIQTHHLNFDESKLADCDDDDVNVWRLKSAFIDLDDDGFGIGRDKSYCIGSELPENLSLNSSDCDDTNSEIFTALPYSAVDIDLDGFQVRSTGSLCTDGSLIQTHHLNFDESKLPDCDDGDINAWRVIGLFLDEDGDVKGAGAEVQYCIGEKQPESWVLDASDCDDSRVDVWRNEWAYPDTDGDNFGDSAGKSLTCIGSSLPEGLVFDDTDCDDSNIAIWRTDIAYVDLDGDGIGTGERRPFCTNLLPALNTSYMNYDCNDNDVGIYRNIVIYLDIDGDGVGAGRGSLTCMGHSYLEAGVSIYGYDPEPEDAEISNFDLAPSILSN